MEFYKDGSVKTSSVTESNTNGKFYFYKDNNNFTLNEIIEANISMFQFHKDGSLKCFELIER